MISIEFFRELGRQQMVVSDSESDERSRDYEYREQMLRYNKPAGLLERTVELVDGVRKVSFSIAGHESLEQYCGRRKLKCGELCRMLSSILSALKGGREYLLGEEDYLLGTDTIFVDKNGDVKLAYFGGYNRPLRERLTELAEYLMNRVNYEDENAVVLIYSFYMKTKEEDCSLDALIEIVNEKGRRNRAVAEQSPAAGEGGRPKPEPGAEKYTYTLPRTVPDERKALQTGQYKSGEGAFEEKKTAAYDAEDEAEDYEDDGDEEESFFKELLHGFAGKGPVRKLLLAAVPLAAAAFFLYMRKSRFIVSELTGETDTTKLIALAAVCLAAAALGIKAIVSKEAEEEKAESITECLGKVQDPEATVLLYDGRNAVKFQLVSDEFPAIIADRFPYYIGKDAGRSDCVLSHLGVSRHHLKIERRGGAFTVTDLGSTNGTFVNGEQLAPHTPREIVSGDELKIARSIYYVN